MIFNDRYDYEKFIAILKREIERYGVRLYVFALMGNHYHLLVETPGANLSEFMHRLQTTYVVYFNRRHKRYGHLFQGRYKAIVVEKDSYLMELSRYIHLNPVRAGIKSMPDEWEWSSYREYISLRRKEKWIEREEVLKYFKKRAGVAALTYRDWVEAVVETIQPSPMSEISGQILLGGDDFIAEMKEKVKSRIDDSGFSNETPSLRCVVSWSPEDAEKALSAIAGYYGVSVDFLKTVHRPSTRQRDVAIYLFNKISGWRLREIAKVFAIDYSAVSKASLRVSKQIENNKQSKKEITLLYSLFKT